MLFTFFISEFCSEMLLCKGKYKKEAPTTGTQPPEKPSFNRLLKAGPLHRRPTLRSCSPVCPVRPPTAETALLFTSSTKPLRSDCSLNPLPLCRFIRSCQHHKLTLFSVKVREDQMFSFFTSHSIINNSCIRTYRQFYR